MFKFLKKNKPFVGNEEELSEVEKKLISDHRKSISSITRQQQNMENELARLFEPTQNMKDNGFEYLYDFIGGWHTGNNQIVPIQETPPTTVDGRPTVTELVINAGTPQQEVIAKVISVKPIDVLKELETIPGPDMIANIDAKILVLKSKEKLIRDNHYSKQEVINMVVRLENRKKWPEFKEFYEQFDNTTSDKVQDLVNKYKLVLRGSDLFIGNMPDEAIAIMSEYVEQTKKLCQKQPIFYVIAEESAFKEQYKKKDPILLVQSPFGAYWQILGAWDKEMILLEEL